MIVRGALLSALLACAACGSSPKEIMGAPAAGLLTLEAWGGPSGQVAAEVPLAEPGVGQQETCAVPMDAGACKLTLCTLGGIGSPAGGFGDFGTITASVGSATVSISYNGGGYPSTYFPAPVTLGTGGMMRFRGGGSAGVPTFDVSATIPGVAVLTSPAPPADGAPATIDSSRDLSVTWAPISIGQIHFRLYGSDVQPGGTALSIACTFEGGSGAGVVPQLLLSSLNEVRGKPAIYASTYSELDATTSVEGLTIQTQSYQVSATPHPDFAVTLQ